LEVPEGRLAVDANAPESLRRQKVRRVSAVVDGAADLLPERWAPGQPERAGLVTFEVEIGRAASRPELHLCLELAAPAGHRLDTRVERNAIHHVHLVRELSEARRGNVAGEAHADLRPGRLRGQDRHPAIDQRAAWEIPAIIVVVDVEPTQRYQDHSRL